MNPVSESVLKKPIFLIGSPRSGTSFLSRLLRRHHALAYIGEPRITWRYGNDRRSDMLGARDARDDVAQYIRAAFAKQIIAQGKNRLVEKTPSNALRLDFINQIFPDAQFVHIMRHGMDSALSIRSYWQSSAKGIGGAKIRKGALGHRLREINWRQMPYYMKEVIRRALPKSMSKLAGPAVWGPRIPGLEGLLRDLDILEVCCLQWRMCVESACHFGRQLPTDRYFECRLEDMSPQLVGAIFEFCGLDDDQDVRAHFDDQYDPKKASARKQKCSDEERQAVLRWIGPTLQWLGYQLQEDRPPHRVDMNQAPPLQGVSVPPSGSVSHRYIPVTDEVTE